MKVVLINPPQKTNYPQPPMGLALLGAILESNNESVDIIDLNIRRAQPYSWTRARGGDVACFTAMTSTINSALAEIRAIKRDMPEIRVVLGGVHATLLPMETLKECPEIDLIVIGEGDNQITTAVSAAGNKGIFPPNPNPIDLDSLPYLAYHLLPWKKYRPHPPHGKALPVFPMITSRGCPFHCEFCAGSVFGRKYRAQSAKRVVDEIEYYRKRFGAKEIAFYDDVFTMDKKRAYEISDEILRRRLRILWTCETRVNLVDKELLEIMKRSGCYSIAYGIESGSQEILDSMCKGITLEQVETAVRMTNKAGIETVGYFMIGSPEETAETVSQTIQFAKSLKLDYAQFSIATPFPGTLLYNRYMDVCKGEISWEDFSYAKVGRRTSPVFESKNMSRGDIENWVSKAYKEFYLRPSYIYRRLMGIKSVGDVKVLVSGFNMLKGM